MSWRPTAGLGRVSVLPAALTLFAVLARQPDLLVLAAPLALAAVPLARRPTGIPQVRLTIAGRSIPEGDPVPVSVEVTDAAGTQTAALVLATTDWVLPTAGRQVNAVLRPASSEAFTLTADLTARRWGHSTVGPGTVVLSACGGLLRAVPDPLPATRLRVLPLAARYTSSQMLPRASGAVGLHRSMRAGEGNELAGIRPFAAGDRMRRINWRTSLRSAELQVNATTTERDATVQVLLDARYDGGTSGGLDGEASGVDVAVRATAALTAFYLQLGDRVGLATFTGATRLVPARAGRGQLERVLVALLDASAPRAGGIEPQFTAPPHLDPRALVLIVSPLVGRHVFEAAAALARGGHVVLVIDTLPLDLLPADGDAWAGPVTALWRLERTTRIGRLADFGVPVISWQGSGSLNATLMALTRAAARSGARR